MKLLQEKYSHYENQLQPWRVLITTMLLQRTQHEHVEPILGALFTTYPERADFVHVPLEYLQELLHPLGFGLKRPQYIMEAMDVVDEIRGWRDLVRVKGIGQYTHEAWRMLVEGDRSFWPQDRQLRLRMIELRLDIKPVQDFSNRMYLHLLDDGNYVYLIGRRTKKDSRELFSLPHKQYITEHFRDSNEATVKHLLTVWNDNPYSAMTPRAKEIIMSIISVVNRGQKDATASKFETMEAAIEASPAGAEVIDTEVDLERAAADGGYSLPALTEIYNVLVDGDHKLKGFADKKTAISRIKKAADDLPTTTVTEGGEPGPKPITKKAQKEADRAAKKDQKDADKAAKDADKAAKKAERDAAKAAGTGEMPAAGYRATARAFMTLGRVFSMDELAAELGLSASKAHTKMSLITKDPGAHYHALAVEKLEEGEEGYDADKVKYRVTQEPSKIVTETPAE